MPLVVNARQMLLKVFDSGVVSIIKQLELGVFLDGSLTGNNG
jgi:hypothetical protein